ncbi:substrate-binding periplasmic protein [Pigmentibacter ruber]|uniref:substrate-binding periplasmic protein n=1 Tax=Pigmentibacter ruber TaxID=2683196 RepID=UPI00131E97EB|nr:transporter substrate-binding domain-containing protein [Pigmentibacter ruber]
MKRKKIIYFLISLIINKAATPIQAESMKVCFEDFKPSAYFINDKPAGIDVEILTEIMQTQNIEVNYVMKPWNSCIYDLDMQRVDAVIPMVYSKERDEKYSLGSSIRTRGNFLVASKNFTKKINSFKDMDKLSVLFGTGYSISKEFDEASNFNKISVTSSDFVYEKILNMVSSMRVDVGIIDAQIYPIIIKKLNLENKVKILDFKLTKETHVGFTKNNKFFPLYERGIKKVDLNYLVNKKIEKYLKNN